LFAEAVLIAQKQKHLSDHKIVCEEVLRFHFQGYFMSGISIARMLGMPTGQPSLLLVGKLDADVRV